MEPATAIAPAETTDPKPKNASKIRKRAPKACLSCRARKVRCDVSQRGRPCMNCYLDSETCVVTGRASRFRRSQQIQNGENAQASYPPYAGEHGNHTHTDTAEAVVKSRANVQAPPEDSNSTQSQAAAPPATETAEQPQAAAPPSVQDDNEPAHGMPPSQTDHMPAEDTSMRNVNPNTAPPNFSQANQPMLNMSTTFPDWTTMLSWNQEPKPGMASDITYSYYPFLQMSNLPNIPPQDVNYLEMQGCLRVPMRPILDEFVQQYFLHVHPLLPLLRESDFWEMYCRQQSGGSQDRMSLLVFQALIFATCNFVSRNTLRALGYNSIRTARAGFYRRAKLLYDMETEVSPIAIGQAAILLSFWSHSSTGIKNPSPGWLSTAIQQAKTAEAHNYTAFPPGKRANVLKRLWWCCIIRDRIMGLGTRRCIQITRSHFDLEASAPLGYADLEDEIERSKVYNSGTKRCLIEILVQIVELCIVLTDILVLVFPLDDNPGWGRQMEDADIGKVKQCKIELRRWYKGATLKFPMFGGGSVARLQNGGKEFHHDSVILYTNLMYMYYHSSRVALCHHEVLHIAVASATSATTNGSRDVPRIYENRHELQDAASGVTECLKELIQLQLARWLPISAVACTALPLVLHILDVKLSTPTSRTTSDNDTSSALKQHRLNILIEAMKTYQPQYDGVDWVSETIRHIINLAQLDGPPATSSPDSSISDWTDILATHPSLYLRLALTMDLALSKNRMPEERDFPASLRGLFTGNVTSIRSLLEQGKAADRKRQAAAAAAPAAPASFNPTLASGTAMSTPSALMADFAASNMMPADFSALPYTHMLGVADPTTIPMGTVTALPSDAATSPSTTNAGAGSPPSVVSGEARPVSRGTAAATLGMAAFAEGMEGLEGHMLDAFVYQDESPPSTGSDMFGGEEEEWMEGSWNGEGEEGMDVDGGEEGRGDHETARALLDAMKGEEVVV